jgi:hypothetical protein
MHVPAIVTAFTVAPACLQGHTDGSLELPDKLLPDKFRNPPPHLAKHRPRRRLFLSVQNAREQGANPAQEC